MTVVSLQQPVSGEPVPWEQRWRRKWGRLQEQRDQLNVAIKALRTLPPSRRDAEREQALRHELRIICGALERISFSPLDLETIPSDLELIFTEWEHTELAQEKEVGSARHEEKRARREGKRVRREGKGRDQREEMERARREEQKRAQREEKKRDQQEAEDRGWREEEERVRREEERARREHEERLRQEERARQEMERARREMEQARQEEESRMREEREREENRQQRQRRRKQRQLTRLARLDSELNRLPLVRYVPAPDFASGFNQPPTPEWLARWVPSDLQSICIERHNASCNICLQDFEVPQLKLPPEQQDDPEEIPLPESLRQMVCRHVFHQLCIDAYLESDDSGRYFCPVCHQPTMILQVPYETTIQDMMDEIDEIRDRM